MSALPVQTDCLPTGDVLKIEKDQIRQGRRHRPHPVAEHAPEPVAGAGRSRTIGARQKPTRIRRDWPSHGLARRGRHRLTSALPLAGLAATARIAVVGAGLAGLTAARELRKAGLNPDVYEGSTRIGGRCYSARGVFSDGQVAEHGGEFIDSDHKEIRDLAKELGLTLDDVLKAKPPNTRSLYVFNDRPYNLAEATRDWQLSTYPAGAERRARRVQLPGRQRRGPPVRRDDHRAMGWRLCPWRSRRTARTTH